MRAFAPLMVSTATLGLVRSFRPLFVANPELTRRQLSTSLRTARSSKVLLPCQAGPSAPDKQGNDQKSKKEARVESNARREGFEKEFGEQAGKPQVTEGGIEKLSKLGRRLIEKFPLLSMEDLKALDLRGRSSSEGSKEGDRMGVGDDSFALVMDEIGAFLEELKALVGMKDLQAIKDLRDINQFKGLLNGDFKDNRALQNLRQRSMEELQELKEEIEELLEIKVSNMLCGILPPR
ncbi:unnamed protein product [Discosporangium mesarthrocarpum]